VMAELLNREPRHKQAYFVEEVQAETHAAT